MRVIIVGHHKRRPWIDSLADALLQDGAAVSIVIDHDGKGAHWCHREALKLAQNTNQQCVIMEDDAVPVKGFIELAEEIVNVYPHDLISFYLGTGRPPQWQSWIDNAISSARLAKRDRIVIPTLVHGVCYTVPPERVGDLIRRIRPGAADYAVGEAWGRPVVYPIASLVEHRDGPSVEVHPDGEARTEVRRARLLAGPLMEI